MRMRICEAVAGAHDVLHVVLGGGEIWILPQRVLVERNRSVDGITLRRGRSRNL